LALTSNWGIFVRHFWGEYIRHRQGYRSDFDLLIIVSDKRLTDRVKYWTKLDERLMREYGVTGTLQTPVNFIVHTLQEVNDGLAHGRYFFMDVKAEGVAVYQSDDTELHTPKPKTPTQALNMAKEYFEDWLPSAESFMRGYGHAVDDGDLKKAAFDLHQACERLYHTVLLVCTFYTPHMWTAPRLQGSSSS
jgi:predicted nucleotidyltransferase